MGHEPKKVNNPGTRWFRSRHFQFELFLLKKYAVCGFSIVFITLWRKP